MAKTYKAACTPEFYVFDADLKLTCELPGGVHRQSATATASASWCHGAALVCARLRRCRVWGLPDRLPMRLQACAQAPPQSSSPECCPQLTPAADHGQFDDSRPSKYGGNTPVTGEMGGLLVGRKWKVGGGTGLHRQYSAATLNHLDTVVCASRRMVAAWCIALPSRGSTAAAAWPTSSAAHITSLHRPSLSLSAGEDLRHALDCAIAGKPLERRVKNSIGCNIKVGAGCWQGGDSAQGSGWPLLGRVCQLLAAEGSGGCEDPMRPTFALAGCCCLLDAGLQLVHALLPSCRHGARFHSQPPT